MKYIVRIVSEETFQGLVTGYVGPFDVEDTAKAYARWIEDPEALIETYVETLFEPHPTETLQALLQPPC